MAMLKMPRQVDALVTVDQGCGLIWRGCRPIWCDRLSARLGQNAVRRHCSAAVVVADSASARDEFEVVRLRFIYGGSDEPIGDAAVWVHCCGPACEVEAAQLSKSLRMHRISLRKDIKHVQKVYWTVSVCAPADTLDGYAVAVEMFGQLHVYLSPWKLHAAVGI